MKRWAIRLTALSTVVALGWFTVAWAQRQIGPGEETAQGPDFSKPPVNAAAASVAGSEVHATMSSDVASSGGSAMPVEVSANSTTSSAPADPFASAAKLAGDRYRNLEPQPIHPDPNASALATENSEIATKQASHTEAHDPFAARSGGDAAAAGNQSAAASDNPTKPADPWGLNRGNDLQNTDAGQTGSLQSPPETGADPRLADDPRYSQYGQTGPGANGAASDAGNRYDSPRPSNNTTATENVAPNDGGAALNSSRNNGYNDLVPPPPHGEYQQNPAMDRGSNNALRGNSNDSLQSGRNYGQGLEGGDSPRENILPPRGSQNGLPASNDPYSASGRGMLDAMPTGSNAYGTAASSVNVEGNGRPGDKKLEGAQTPSVTIQKIAPPEIQVGKPAKFEIIVRNTGPVVADDVEVIESIPQGTTLVSTTPPTQTGQRGEVVWKVGELKPAEEAKLQVELMPVAEGEIGSVAVVQFRSQASMRTIATKPELALELSAPKQVMIGGDVTIGIKISNPGTGAAEKIVLHEAVPPGFQHPAGAELEFDVGTLKPGETRQLELTLRAVQAGTFGNTILVSGDANLRAEQTAQVQIVAPALEVAIDGPGLRYLERQAKYSVSVNNPGTAPAKDVELVTRLPKGMQFVEASDMGHYDQNSHSVIWSLAELPAGQAGSVTLTTLAAEAGEQRLRGEGRAAGGLSHTTEETTLVEGVAAVLFTVVDVDDPVEVTGQATYEIKVVNQGSKAASRVLIGALLPPELKPVSAEGPAQHQIDGQRVIFEPMPRLAPKADITYRIVAQAVSPGDSRIRVQLQTDEMTEPVTKEESTRVYKD